MSRIVGALLVLMLLGGCVPATPDEETYRDQASRTLGSAVSEVRTISILLDTLYDDRMLRPTAIAQLRYSESALETETGKLIRLTPPVSQDPLYARATTLLGDAGDLAAKARIVVERKHYDRYPALVGDLEKLAVELERLEGRVS